MAGEYGVNIKFRVVGQSQLDKAKQKAKELEASVSKIRSLDLGKAIKGPVGDRVAEATGQIRRYATQLNKTGKVIGSTRVQQQSALEAFESLRDSVKIGSPIFNTLNKAIAQQTKLMNVNTTSVIKNTRAKNSNNRASVGTKGGMSGGSSALTSGLISGAFPLLFGQGPLGGAFGFAGGFLGTKVGGQMGGFAGGLVATSILQQLTTAIQGLNELGKALDPKTLNIDSISKSLGLLGTDTEKYLKLIEQTEGKQAAYNAAVQETTKLVGQDGVQALQSFADSSQNLTNEMSKFFTRLGSEIAKLVDKVNKQGQKGRIVGFERSNLLAEAKNVTDDAEIIAKVAEIEKERNRNKRTVLQDELVLLMKAKKIEDDRLKKLENSRMEYQLILKSLTDQNTFLQNAITLGSSEAAIIQEKTKLIEKAKKAQVDFDENEIDRQLRLKAELQRTKQLYDSIANSIQGGLVDALEGAINGTKSLGDVARSVFGAIQRQLINFAATSFLKSLPGIGGFFANGGRPPVGRASIVGERGPELFVPDRAGTIVPNHQLGGMGGSTSIVVNVDASGSSVEGDEEQANAFGSAIATAIQSELIKQKRPGGLLA